MRRDQINFQLSKLAFDFFFAFSRFEFCLKENQYLKSSLVGDKAMPGWSSFIQKWADKYTPSEAAQRIIDNPPNIQVVGCGSVLTWCMPDLTKSANDLSKVTDLLKIIRNNLFHGGKHADKGWDDPKRTEVLISDGLIVLNELVELANFLCDFDQKY